MKCYNCGDELNPTNRTKEHIPAQAFYVGYGDEYKANRITVPACRICNEKYSKTDQEIRDAIGMANENDDKAKELTRKSAKSILIKKRNKLHFDETGKLIAVGFDYKDFRSSAIKDFKGIFYHKYGYPLPKGWKVEIIADFENEKKLVSAAVSIYAYLDKDTGWAKSGHVDIFRYKIKTFVPDENNSVIDTGEITKAILVASVQEYHNKIGFIVVASKSSILRSIKKEKTGMKKPRNTQIKLRSKKKASKSSRKKNRRQNKK